MIPVNRPLLDGKEKEYLCECIDTGWISSEGPFVRRLEEHFETLCERRHGIAVSNGSAALDIALASIDLKPGDEVILPTFTIISCVQAILRAGAIPVVVDCEALTWNMNVSQIEALITKKTRAIMAVHIYGLPCDMDAILALAEKYDLLVIEDAAEAHGLMYKGRPCGSFGDVSTFSFYPNKLVTTGEGGLVLTNNDVIAERTRAKRNLCFQAAQRFVHEDLGWNMRMSNLQAAVGCAQVERLQEFVALKRSIGSRYVDLLSGQPMLQLPLQTNSFAENIYWVFGVVIEPEDGRDARHFMDALKSAGIQTRPFFWPLHQQPVLLRQGLFAGVQLPVAERVARFGFYIPSGLGVTSEEQSLVALKLKETLVRQ